VTIWDIGRKTITFRAKPVVVRSNRDSSCWVCFARALVCLVLALSRCAPGVAQTVYGSIVGQVSDISGAVVKDASVTAIDLGTSESRSGTTKSDGDYQFVNLLPGRYRIEVTAAGFKLFSRDPIDVRVDSVVRVDATLAVGAANESIEVQEQTSLLDTQNSSAGQVIEGRQVQETPLNGRNVMNLLALVPGVIPQGGTQGSTAGNYTASGDLTNVAGFGNYQIDGGLAGQNTFLFDGAPVNEVMSNGTVLVPTQDAVQEFRVATSVPNPEIGALAACTNICGIPSSMRTTSSTMRVASHALSWYKTNSVLRLVDLSSKSVPSSSSTTRDSPVETEFPSRVESRLRPS
jgi:hypothetical protein